MTGPLFTCSLPTGLLNFAERNTDQLKIAKPINNHKIQINV